MALDQVAVDVFRDRDAGMPQNFRHDVEVWCLRLLVTAGRWLPPIVDVSLADYDRLWVAVGTRHTILLLSYPELVTITSERQEQVGD